MVLTFLSTPSVRRATITLSEFFAKAEDFYPRPPRGGRLGIGTRIVEVQVVSIHALREEGDLVVRELLLIVSSISIHALREEGDFRWTLSRW